MREVAASIGLVGLDVDVLLTWPPLGGDERAKSSCAQKV